MRAVVDTNVIVSALMNANGTPARIVSLILNGKITVLYDNMIMFEYREVLSRKELGFSAAVVNDLLDYIKSEGEYINADLLNMRFPDETDRKFYEVYKSGKAQCLITGNIKHFPRDDAIITPRAALP